MALAKQTIKAEIIAGITEASKTEAAQGIDKFADKLADIIINAIKTADLTIPPQAIVVAGSATTQTNAAPIKVPTALS